MLLFKLFFQIFNYHSKETKLPPIYDVNIHPQTDTLSGTDYLLYF